jgi:hypothetical protein
MVNDGPGEKSWGRGGIDCHVATIVVVEAADPHLADPAFCLVAVCSCLTYCLRLRQTPAMPAASLAKLCASIRTANESRSSSGDQTGEHTAASDTFPTFSRLLPAAVVGCFLQINTNTASTDLPLTSYYQAELLDYGVSK